MGKRGAKLTTSADFYTKGQDNPRGRVALCMIVKDEEAILEQCLRSVVDFVDEVVIVDTGSKDGTVKLAKQYATTFERFKWRDSFADARNFAMGLAKSEWILTLDADDVVFNPQELPELIANANQDNTVCGIYSHYLQDKATRQKRLQLFRAMRHQWEGVVHENPMLHAEWKVADNSKPKPTYWMSELVVIHNKPMKRIAESAQQYLDILLKYDPSNYFGLAESYKILANERGKDWVKQSEEAVRQYKKAIHWPYSNDATKYISLCNVANLYLRLGTRCHGKTDLYSLEAAKDYAAQAIKMDESRAEGWCILGFALEAYIELNTHLNDRTKAREARQNAIVVYTQAGKCETPSDGIGIVWHKMYGDVPTMRRLYLEQKS